MKSRALLKGGERIQQFRRVTSIGSLPSENPMDSGPKNCQYSTDRQRCDQNLAPVLVIRLWNSLRRQKVGYGMVVDGIAKFQALKFTFQGLKFPVKSLVLLVRRRIPQKFQALKFQNLGPEIWRIHPPPLHTSPFACLLSRRLTFIQYRAGVSKCHRSVAPDPPPSTGKNLHHRLIGRVRLFPAPALDKNWSPILWYFLGVVRQTKPKKGQFMNFSQGHSGTKVRT